jgi:hypothetical protein
MKRYVLTLVIIGMLSELIEERIVIVRQNIHKRHYVTLILVRIATQTLLRHFDFLA